MSTSGTAPATVQPRPLSTHVFIEALGSFFIVFAGMATALFSASTSTVAFGYGLAMVAALVAFGSVSTGYFNPVFSLAMAVAGRIKWLHMVVFVLAQAVGAVLASGVIYALVNVLPSESTGGVSKVFATLSSGFDSHSPLKVPMVGVMIVELVAAAVLVAIILGATHARNATVLAPVGIGLALAVTITIALPVANSSLNPAASTAAAFLTDSWAAGQLWLFWLAPLFGAALAAAIYRTFAPQSAAASAGAADEAAADNAAAADAAAKPGAIDYSAPSARGVDAAVDGGVPAPVPATPAAAAAVEPAAAKSDAQDFFDAPSK
ncbi:aquaporin [Arthrobacter sp. STN4]|uniref:aquaporin n=1 Tax=Arthrobacter sp. STN4 TaxID=2923276 RepID=UPI00211A9C19|nr:aquaporin [Arthrobacter sp. STN4]MCQ9163256.1 aquaporin [Arthrobacter sp. STN4]